MQGCKDALSRKWQLNIGTMAQHGCTSGAGSDNDDLPPRMAEAGLSMHLSVTYHSPNCRKKSNLLSLFSVQDLSEKKDQRTIFQKIDRSYLIHSCCHDTHM